jgi:hypothetical protein
MLEVERANEDSGASIHVLSFDSSSLIAIHFKSRIKMESRDKFMITGARKLVLDEPATFALIKAYCAAVGHWKLQSFVSVMFRDNHIPLKPCLPK